MKFKVEAKLCLEFSDLIGAYDSAVLRVNYDLYRSYFTRKFIIFGKIIEKYPSKGTFHSLKLLSDTYDKKNKAFIEKNEEVENYLNNPILIKNKLEECIMKMIKKEFGLDKTSQELKVNKINEKGILNFEFEFDPKEQKNDD